MLMGHDPAETKAMARVRLSVTTCSASAGYRVLQTCGEGLSLCELLIGLLSALVVGPEQVMG